MSQIHYASSYQCDCCGVMANVQPPTNHLYRTPTPDGWMTYNLLPNNEDLEFAISLRGGRNVYRPDLCNDCKTLPFQTVIRRIIERHASSSL